MATILREITVDVAQLNRFQAIVAKQYDRQSRYLKVQLTNLGEPIQADLDAMVVINARREDGVANVFAGTVNADGTVTVPLTYWMLELDGTVKCDISIIVGEESVLTTTLFELEVQEAAADDEAIEENEDYSLLVQLLQDVQETEQELTSGYEQSAINLKNTYEASMNQALADVETAIAAAQLVTSPFYIVDNDNHKTYQAAIQVTGGKPIMVYDEFTGGNE
ncbi:MAG: BppU family phage baseplate upper protein [Clostridia bacterium]|nr:BppU family phage baseplate upper protein [Clostridia bacterium]